MLLSLYRYRSLYRRYRSRKERRQARQEKERKGRRDGRSKEESKGRRWGGMKNLKLHNLYNSWQLVSRLTTHFPLSPLIKLLSLPLHQNCSSQGYQGHPRGYTKESVVISPHFELHHLLAMYLLSSPSPRNTSFTWLPSHHTYTVLVLLAPHCQISNCQLTSSHWLDVLMLEFLKTQSFDYHLTLSAFTPWVISFSLIASNIICIATALFSFYSGSFLHTGTTMGIWFISLHASDLFSKLNSLPFPIKPSPGMDSAVSALVIPTLPLLRTKRPSISLISCTQSYRIPRLSHL